MKPAEVIALKRYIEGAYQQVKANDGSDQVWVDNLLEYDFQGMMMAVKERIKEGNKYAPNIAELIASYKAVLSSLDSEIISMMVVDGVFNDETGPEETKIWNSTNRQRKAEVWLSHPMRSRVWPEWFKELYRKYQTKLKGQLYNNVKLIGE